MYRRSGSRAGKSWRKPESALFTPYPLRMCLKMKKQIFHRPERCLFCLSCELACAATQKKARREELPAWPRLKAGHLCSHCQDAPCVRGCTSGAMHFDERGYVISDPEKCVGCWMCIALCPHGAVIPRPDGERKVWKCDGCQDRGSIPACTAACPTGALVWSESPWEI